MIKKYIILVTLMIVVSGGFLLVFFIWSNTTKATLQLVIANDTHTPYNTEIMIDDEVLYPEEPGGKNYLYTGRPGSVSVAIVGPSVGSEEYSTELSSGNENRFEIPITYLSDDEIIKNVIGETTSEDRKLSNYLLSQDKLWAFTTFQLENGDSIVSVSTYSFDSMSWTTVSEGTELNIDLITNTGAPYEFINRVKSI